MLRCTALNPNEKEKAAPTYAEQQAKLPFEDQDLIYQVSTIVETDINYPLSDQYWGTLWGQAAGNSVFQNQIDTNGEFINRYGKTPNAEADLAWQAYLFWLSFPTYEGTLEEYQAEPLAQYNYVNFGGWSGDVASFEGYGGWWTRNRRTEYFNNINLM